MLAARRIHALCQTAVRVASSAHCGVPAARAVGSTRSIAGFADHYGLFIDGKEVPAAAGGTFTVEDPATGNVLTTVSEGRGEDVDAAVDAATRVFASGEWARADPRDRAAVMNRAAALLAERVAETAELESLQTGRAIRWVGGHARVCCVVVVVVVVAAGVKRAVLTIRVTLHPGQGDASAAGSPSRVVRVLCGASAHAGGHSTAVQGPVHQLRAPRPAWRRGSDHAVEPPAGA